MNTISDDNIGDIVLWTGILGNLRPMIIIKTKKVNMYNEVRFQVLQKRSFSVNLPMEYPITIKYKS